MPIDPEIPEFFNDRIAEITAYKEWYLRLAEKEPDVYDAELLEGSGFEETFDEFRMQAEPEYKCVNG